MEPVIPFKESSTALFTNAEGRNETKNNNLSAEIIENIRYNWFLCRINFIYVASDTISYVIYSVTWK
jgi:hypothetical protein